MNGLTMKVAVTVASLLIPVSTAGADDWVVESPEYVIEAGRAAKGCTYTMDSQRRLAGTVAGGSRCFFKVAVAGGVLACDYAIRKTGEQAPTLEPDVGNPKACADSVLFCPTRQDDGSYHWLVQPAAVC